MSTLEEACASTNGCQQKIVIRIELARRLAADGTPRPTETMTPRRRHARIVDIVGRETEFAAILDVGKKRQGPKHRLSGHCPAGLGKNASRGRSENRLGPSRQSRCVRAYPGSESPYALLVAIVNTLANCRRQAASRDRCSTVLALDPRLGGSVTWVSPRHGAWSGHHQTASVACVELSPPCGRVVVGVTI